MTARKTTAKPAEAKAPARKRATTKARPTKAADVKIAAAKGRPMLTWVGKKPLTRVTPFPAQHVETFDPAGDAATRTGPEWDDWPSAYPRGGLLFHGDNKEVLAHLLANGFRGKVDLIYIDPPFDSGADYVRRVSLRGAKGSAKLDGEGYTLGEQIQYEDIWANDTYLQFMYERLLLLRELLSPTGAMWLHCDWNKSPYLRLLLDEVFGPSALVNEIAWQRISAHPDSSFFGHIHDTLLLYAPSREHLEFHQEYSAYGEDFVQRYFSRDDNDGRGPYWTGDLTAPGPRPNLEYEFKGHLPPSGRAWFAVRSKLEALDADGRIYWPPKGGVPKLKRYLAEYPGIPASSMWTDIRSLAGLGAPVGERLDYPTQKPRALLERIIRSTSGLGAIVLDCFAGSGTTLTVAQELGRRWIGCDINKGAILTTAKRLQGIIEAQAANGQETLLEDDAPRPAQLSFTTWRVNDYDLQIQHNEAVALACEHIGVQRTRTDRFFDGTLGKNLVKVNPFTHPLSPADLEDIRTELEARPDEDRSVTVVCLGMELAAKDWLDGWNRIRRGRNSVNRIEVIELRTDERYGAFLTHDPASAKVAIERRGGKVLVRIDDFLSPSIVKRLAEQTGVVEPRIDDWRAMVDCVMIDGSYDGRVFDVALSDVPERKADLVRGEYELPAPKGKTTVAVKIVDMLGEEVLETARV